MDVVLSDLRVTLRQLARTPAFTLTALITLALAVGATTAVFSLLNGVVLNPLDFAAPNRLVYLQSTDPSGKPMTISPQDLLDFQSQTHSFTQIAAIDARKSMNLMRLESPAVRINATRVGGSFFSILGVTAQQGRLFGPGSDAKIAPKVVVLSDGAWRRYFGGDPKIVGQHVALDDDSYTIVGIAPPRMAFPGSPDLWLPAVWRDYEVGETARGYHSIEAIARLAPGTTLDGARRDLSTVAARIARDYPQYDAKVGAVATPLQDQIMGSAERPLWILFGAVGFVLLIACANVGNLMLVRAASRESEIALRTALGASRGRLIRQFLTESTLLSLGGTLLGALVATWAVAAIVRFGPSDLPRLAEVSVDAPVLIFAAVLGVLAGLGFGLLPAIHFVRPNLTSMMHASSRSVASGASRTHSALVVGELALGTVLLVGAGLLIRSFQHLLQVDPGIVAQHVIVLDVALSGPKYDYDAGVIAFADAVQSRLTRLPGVEAAAVAANRPFDADPGFAASTSFTVDGEPRPAPGLEPESSFLPVSPSYFRTLGMTLLRGRAFTDAENRIDAAPVVVINEALAEKYFHGVNPVGKHITFGIKHTVTASPGDSVRARGEIVGVVRTVQHTSLSATPEPATYFPYNTLPVTPTFAVRTTANPATIEREAREQVAAVDRNAAVYGMQTLEDAISTSVAQPRFYTAACSAFAMVALLLAGVGIFGVVSYAAVQRTREFGIRLALGATTRQILRLVLGRSARMAVGGLVLGIVGAVLTTRAMRGMLFGVQPLDPVTFACVCVVLGGTATLAAWLPARRAARVDPVVTMRAD